MVTRVTATWDGEALRLDEPVPFEENTRVQLTIEPLRRDEPAAESSAEHNDAGTLPNEPYSWLRIAREAALPGPSDASQNWEDYAYHGKPWSRE